MDKDSRIKELEWELLMVSKLASTDEKHKFISPFNAALAEKIRDRVLNPTPLPQ